MKPLLLPLLTLALALPLAGCSKTLPARINLKGKRLLVIPFAQGPAREFDSTFGRDLADATSGAVRSSPLPKGAAVLDFRDAERLMPRGRTESPDWPRLGAALKADYLLLGEVKLYQLRDPKALTTRRGTLIVAYRVLDVAHASYALLVPSRTFYFPPQKPGDTEFAFGTDSFAKAEEIAGGLLATAARGLAEEFYEREEEP